MKKHMYEMSTLCNRWLGKAWLQLSVSKFTTVIATNSATLLCYSQGYISVVLLKFVLDVQQTSLSFS